MHLPPRTPLCARSPFRFGPAAALAALILTATTGCAVDSIRAQIPPADSLSGAAEAMPTPPATPGGGSEPVTVEGLELPVTISHRGGALVYPEESMEGFTASAQDGFLPEMDIQFLSDGTPVLIHDDTADRTLEGASGPIRELSREEWDAARITHPNGGPAAETVTLTELLDELGGKTVLVPEIKPGATSAEVSAVLDEFDARGLKDSLIVQSFDFDTAATIADRGYTSLYLFDDELPAESPSRIAEAGIEWVGPNRSLPAKDVGALAAAGLRVAPYGLKTAEDVSALPEEVSGWFTDDPWDE